jgi:hypothetical protein
MAGLFRNAQEKSVGASRYDSLAEFRTVDEAPVIDFGGRRVPARAKTIWNTPYTEGGYR